MRKVKRLACFLAAVVGAVVVLFLIAASVLYIPAVQRWAKDRACAYVGSTTGIDVSIERLRLAFPIDLTIEGVLAVEGRDTLLCVDNLRVHARLLPLLGGRVCLETLRLRGARVNTLSHISNTHITGSLELFEVYKPTEADLKAHRVEAERIRLEGTSLLVALCDTAAADTTGSEPQDWVIDVARVELSEVEIGLRMPGDSMRVAAWVGRLDVDSVCVDLGAPLYSVGGIELAGSRFAYDVPWAARAEGLDFNHLTVDSVLLSGHGVSYGGSGLHAPIDRLSLREGSSGLGLDSLRCTVDLDESQLRLSDLVVVLSGGSRLTAAVALPLSALETGSEAEAEAEIEGRIAKADAERLVAGAADYLGEAPLYMYARARGNADNLTGDYRLEMGLSGLAGDVALRGERISTVSHGSVGRGSVDVDGFYDMASGAYGASIETAGLRVGDVVEGVETGPLTLEAEVDGVGFDFGKSATRLQARARIGECSYGGYVLDGTQVDAELRGGHLTAQVGLSNRMARADVGLQADLGDEVRASVSGRVQDLALQYFASGMDSVHVGGSVDGRLVVSEWGLTGEVSLADVWLSGPERGFMGEDLRLSVAMAGDSVEAYAESGDMELAFASARPIDDLAGRALAVVDTLKAQAVAAQFDQAALSRGLPGLRLSLHAGRENLLRQFLEAADYDFDSLSVVVCGVEGESLSVEGELMGLQGERLELDRVVLTMSCDTSALAVEARIENTDDDNPNRFIAAVEGQLLPRGAQLETTFVDSEGAKGMDFGVRAEKRDSDWTFSLFPDTMTLAYRQFAVNEDNFFVLTPDYRVAADIDLLADDSTSLRLLTGSSEPGREMALSIDKLRLYELTQTLPFLPLLGGLMGADVEVEWTDSLTVSASGEVGLTDFAYEGTELGSWGADFVYLPDERGNHSISACLETQSLEVMRLDGTYYGDSAWIDGLVVLDSLPADIVNAFMPDDGSAALAGRLGGELRISGPTDAIAINGSLQPDSLQILSPLYNVALLVEDRPLAFEDSRLVLDSVRLTSSEQSNPLIVDGEVDLSNLEAVAIDLTFKARDFRLIDAKQNRTSLVYGNVYADIDAALRGTTEFMRITGSLDLLSRTDVTYIMKDTPLTVEDQLSGLVEFVSFNDTTVVVEDSVGLRPEGIYMNLTINVAEQAQLHALLSEDGSSYLDAQGGGSLNMQYLPSGEMSLTGTYTLSGGEMKYELPIIPLKTFSISEGSSIRFTGEMMDPTLNITALESTRAAVSDDGTTTRMVDFNVGVSVTNKLSDMELEFLIEAPNDLNVQSELNSLGASERSKLALTLLATGVYMSENNQSSFQANNALNAFLQSEIQSIAGNALRSVDITVGVEGSTSATGESQTDYSFQFSKKLWNDRVTFKIGGKVTTGSSQSEENNTFIDNVSLEYRLDSGGTRSLQAFYDHSQVDPFEGSYSSAGVGYIWRKKLSSLSELLIKKR